MPATDRAIDEYISGLAKRLDAAGHGERGRLVSEAAKFLSMSKNGVYKRLQAIGWTSGRKRRADAGARAVSQVETQIVANLMFETTRANGKRLLSVEDALDIARANGCVSTDASPKTFLRAMREHGVHPDQLARPTPHVTLRSLHPNHVWEFDVSVCVLYYLDRGGLAVMEEKEFYKNKPQNITRISKDRVLRYLVTDHYSGALYVRYYLVAGEDQETLFDFLMRAFAKRDHAQDPFHGVPLMMLWDAGSANQSHLIRNLLDRLQVRHQAHTPGVPRAKGQVERTHDLVERHFEGRLSFMRIQSIDELNDKAHIWMRAFNMRKTHSRTRTTRYGLWQTIREEQLRLCPPRELCESLLRTKPEPRTVKGNLVIGYAVKGFGPKTYSVSHVPDVRVGESLNVCVNPYRTPNVFVVTEDADGAERLFECVPIETDAAGFPIDAPVIGESYRAMPDTDTDRQRKRMAKDAYGADTQAEVDKARKRREPAFGGAIDPITYLENETVASYMPRRGTPLEMRGADALELKPLTIIEALNKLSIELNRTLTREENDRIRAQYPDGVPEDELGPLAAWLCGGDAPDTRLSQAT